MSKMFGSNFMSNQGEIGEESGSGGDGANVSRPPYDADGNAHLESVLLVIVSFFLLLFFFKKETFPMLITRP